ncbi:transcription factor grauzone-like isoform X1 [Sabethes cyaneus]|uniref:transcription factor grauzone-like isoform X1 n=1 Tax=Sabethes cyaneus TaxID=53552 RepID=UPI00237ECB1A|nr:transcription factor grauzone-like isoform X1 [Sabethes cyaneus]
MESLKNGCRLCLDPIGDIIHSIENSEFKKQIDCVFSFPINIKHGYPSSICQNCSHQICDFYIYSEKVRLNQEKLEQIAESKSFLETFKVEPIEKDEPSEVSLDKIEPKDEPEEDCNEQSDGDIFAESYRLPVSRPRKKRKKEERPRRKRGEKPPVLEQDVVKRYNIKSKEQLEQEDKLINEFYRMVCELCGETASNFASLANHFRKIHSRTGYIRCCKRKLPKRYHLLQHMALHSNPSAFRCELCNKNYKHKVYLLLHQAKAHGSEEDRPFKCDRCKQSYVKEYLLRNHMISHEKVQCPQCNKLLANKAALSTHIINKHSDLDRRMICDTCGQEFLNKACFERHVKRHLGVEEVERKYQCHICQKWLMGERGLQKHLQFTHYERDQTHICDICNQQYPNSRALWSHKRIVHIEEKFECEFCGKKFKRAINLKEHRTTHTGEVLYSCDICGATMNSNANLYTHTKKSHPLEWAEKRRKAAEANEPKKQV